MELWVLGFGARGFDPPYQRLAQSLRAYGKHAEGWNSWLGGWVNVC